MWKAFPDFLEAEESAVLRVIYNSYPYSGMRERSGEWVDVVVSPRPNLNDDTDKLQSICSMSICRGACETYDFAIDDSRYSIIYDSIAKQ
jgi:hypothetical protein